MTVAQGTNKIVGSDPERVVTEALAILDGKSKDRARAGVVGWAGGKADCERVSWRISIDENSINCAIHWF